MVAFVCVARLVIDTTRRNQLLWSIGLAVAAVATVFCLRHAWCIVRGEPFESPNLDSRLKD